MNYKSEDIRKIILKQDYQSIPPFVIPILEQFLGGELLEVESKSKTLDKQRYQFMRDIFRSINGRILDIGANSGYFSLGYCVDDNCIVDAFEGEIVYVEYLKMMSDILNLDDRLRVYGENYNFQQKPTQKYDLTLCLNVLHHIGRYFDGEINCAEDAKLRMTEYLSNLAESSSHLFFQIGFNWKGDMRLPIFKNGSKNEMIEYVSEVSQSSWSIERIGIFDPSLNDYVEPKESDMLRNDAIGEFANRPLFFMKSKR